MMAGKIASSRKGAVIAGVYLLLYVLVDWLSFVRPALTLGIAPWNPQAGLTLAFLLLYGPRWFPITAVAALISAAFIHAVPGSPLLLIGSSLWIALIHAALAALLRQWGLARPIREAGSAARFAGASVVAALIVAAGYVGLFVAVGLLPPTDALRGITRYWFGDLNGMLMLTPLLIHATDWRESVRVLKQHQREILAQIASVLVTLLIIFGLPAADQLRFFYLLFVPVIWIALRWSLSGSVFAVLAIQIVLIIAAWTGLHTPRFVDLQFLMLTLTMTALLLGAVVSERADVLRRVAMREAEQRALLAMAPDAVLAVDSSGHIRMANAAAVRLFGEQVDAGHKPSLTSMLPGLNLDAVEGRVSLDGRREDGSRFPAEIAWARLDPNVNEGSLVTVRDATDRRRAEEQLRERDASLARAMRFAVAGELASALAHELNQPITALVSYLRASEILTSQSASLDDRVQTTLSKAAKEAIRASEVLRRLRDFYQGGALKRERISIHAVCEAAARAFQDRLRRAEASLSVSVDPEIPAIEGDSLQLEMVLHNLLANAVDAVMQAPVAQRRLELHATCSDGVVTFVVEDSGPGIAPEVARRLFEPFVTSKPDGMGLGLAISRSLIRARGGELSFAPSAKLGGASFTVRIPIELSPDSPLNL
jgi:PAS domain S-box-containing protein